MIIADSERERFQAKVAHDGHGCLVWTGYRSPDRYGRFKATRDGRSTAKMAHRIAYEHAFGEIPEGMQVDHTCLKPECVTPEHFRLVTNKQKLRASAPAPRIQVGYSRGLLEQRPGGMWSSVTTITTTTAAHSLILRKPSLPR
jgi:hypothetical protein